MDRRQPDEIHKETLHLVREIHAAEYEAMHPDVKNILAALCGPVDPLTGLPDGTGINGKVDRIELEQANMSARITDLHENGKVRFSTWAKLVAGSVVTGLFGVLYLLLNHVLGA